MYTALVVQVQHAFSQVHSVLTDFFYVILTLLWHQKKLNVSRHPYKWTAPNNFTFYEQVKHLPSNTWMKPTRNRFEPGPKLYPRILKANHNFPRNLLNVLNRWVGPIFSNKLGWRLKRSVGILVGVKAHKSNWITIWQLANVFRGSQI